MQHLIRKTFENHRGCLRELVNVTSTPGESLRPAKVTFVGSETAPVGATVLPMPLPEAVLPTVTDTPVVPTDTLPSATAAP